MKRPFQLILLSVAFLAAGIFIGYKVADKSQSSLLGPSEPAVSTRKLNPVDSYIDDCLASRSLLEMASATTYESSDSQEKQDLVQDWCLRNARVGYEALSPDDRSFSVRRLKTQLDNLLNERAFDTSL